MKSIEPILSCLTSLTIVDDLRQTLRAKDPEFLPAEEKFQEAIANLTEKLDITEVLEIRLEAQIARIDQVGADLPVHGSHITLHLRNSKFLRKTRNGLLKLFLRRQKLRILLPKRLPQIIHNGKGCEA